MLRSVGILVLMLALAISLAGTAEAACPEADLNDDCRVDFKDVQALAGQWLAGSNSSADLVGGDGVDIADFAMLAKNWGVIGQRTGSLEVVISPQAAIDAGAKWRINDGIWRSSGETVPDLLIGSYTIEFSQIDTWMEPPDQNVEVLEDLTTGVRASYKHPLAINEVMASNSKTKQDPQKQYDDWIEIYNAGNYAIDVGGMHLTDELDDPTRWRIPDNIPAVTTIAAGDYLLIWADGDIQDNGTVQSGLHAGFKLDADRGDEVGLFDSNGTTLINSVEFPDQTADISYGRHSDGNDTWRYFASPTPGTQNISTSAYLGQVADTKFSHNRGFYDDSFSVTIATETEGAEIYYTDNGSCPFDVASETPTGTRYVDPIPIKTTTCLRAVALIRGWKPSNIDAHTYIFLEDVIDQPADIPGYPRPWTWLGGSSYAYHDYEMDPEVVENSAYSGVIVDSLKAIPTLSIASGRANMDVFYWGSGESVVSVELIYPNEPQKNVQAICGVQPHSHNRMKRSMRLNFRAEYGNAQFNSSIFRDAPLNGHSAVDRFDRIVLRGGNNRCWARVWNPERTTYTMDQWYRDTQIAMSGVGSRGTFVHLYINGLYWGLYNPCERPDAWFASSYMGGDREDWYSISHGGSHGGNASRWNYLKGALKDKDMSDPANYAEMQQYLDIEEYIDYIILTWFVGMTDWPGNNWWGANRNDIPGPFMYFGWDAEWSWKTTRGHNNGWVHPDFRSSKSGGHATAAIWHSLRRNKDFMLLFADRVYKHLFNDGVLTDENCKARYLTLNDFVRDAVVAESARWGDTCESIGHPTRTRDVDWVFAENETLGPGFMDGNADKSIASLRNEGYYPDLNPPQFNTRGGHVAVDFEVTLANPNGTGTIYYTIDGNDPRVPVVSQGGTSVKLVAESAPKRVLVPTGDIGDTWTGGDEPFNDSTWHYVSDSPGGVGYDERPDYDPYISYDVESLMNGDLNTNANTSAYIRIPFTVDADDLADFDFMRLGMRYDDGFVAYINGAEVWRERFTGTPLWDSHVTNGHEAGGLDSFDIAHHLDKLKAETNILAVHGLNDETASSDFLISVELVAGDSSTSSGGGDVAPTAIEYTAARRLGESTHIKTRVKSGTTWSALNEAVFAIGPVAEDLRITEIMYHPKYTGNPDDPNREFIELKNIGQTDLNLSLVKFTNGIDFTFPNETLGAGDYLIVAKDPAVFAARYPDVPADVNTLGPYDGRLDNGGERIELQDAIGKTILNFRYKDGWRKITDGGGFSLAIADETYEPNGWDEKDSWRASAFAGGSPGWDDSGIIPNPGSVVINEIMAHSHGTEKPDWIELHNTTDAEIDIGGWYLSDSIFDLKKYRFAEETKIDPHGYIVLYEDANFGDRDADSGCITEFAFSENGDQGYLSSAEGEHLTGYRAVEDFGPSETGVSFGRYFKRSTGNYNFVAMSVATPWLPNAYPKVGPIVINEIMYNPDWPAGGGPAGGSYTNDRYEYVELHNITSGPVKLYRDDKALPWKFTDGIEYTFPASPDEVTIPVGGYVVVVRDLAAFTWRYPGVPAGKVFGPYTGQLSNGGERVELSKPGDIDKFGMRHYIRIDRVVYSDGSHPQDCPGGVDLWPTEADNGGKSLSRRAPALYGNDPNNWTAATPSPGTGNP